MVCGRLENVPKRALSFDAREAGRGKEVSEGGTETGLHWRRSRQRAILNPTGHY